MSAENLISGGPRGFPLGRLVVRTRHHIVMSLGTVSRIYTIYLISLSDEVDTSDVLVVPYHAFGKVSDIAS